MGELVERTYEYMKQKQMGEATGHDWWHTLRVYEMALHLAETEAQPVDQEIVKLGALLMI